MNQQLSPNFSSSEFSCQCGCGKVKVDSRLIEALQTLRDRLEQPIFIHSGYRCPKHNKTVGGRPKSQHLFGKAADFHVPNYTPPQIARHAVQINAFRQGGIGVYPTYIHLDVRDKGPARWGLPWKE